MNIAKYSKFIAAIAGAISVAVTDGIFDLADGVTIVLAGLAALGVYAVPNKPDTPEA